MKYSKRKGRVVLFRGNIPVPNPEARLAELPPNTLIELHEKANSVTRSTGVSPKSFETFQNASKHSNLPSISTLLVAGAIGVAVGVALFFGAAEAFNLNTSAQWSGAFVRTVEPGVKLLGQLLVGASLVASWGITISSHQKAQNKELIGRYEKYLDDFEKAHSPQKTIYADINYRNDHTQRIEKQREISHEQRGL